MWPLAAFLSEAHVAGEQTRAVSPAKASRLLAVPARNWRVIWKRQSSATVVGGHRDAVERAHRWLGGDVELRWVVRHFSLHLIRALVKPLGVISAAPSSPNPPLPALAGVVMYGASL